MRRRALLAAVGSTALAGCSSPVLPTICSRPSFGADRLEFESRDFSSVGRWWHHPGAILATEPDHVARFEPPDWIAEERGLELPADERAFVEETDFDEAIVVGVVVGSSGGSTDAFVTHAVAEGDRVHCYVCIRRRGWTDDLAPQGRLIRVRVPGTWTPETVRVTFTDGTDATDTFDSDGTRESVAGRRDE